MTPKKIHNTPVSDSVSHSHKETLFISDLHLSAQTPVLTKAFFHFIKQQQNNSALECLYILGDFFAYWLGDDTASDFEKSIAQALNGLAQTGIAIYLMRGNRDFALGHAFAQSCGAQLIADFHTVTLYGQSYLLSHGDAFCSDDLPYQRYKRIMRHPVLVRLLLKTPAFIRAQLGKNIRRVNQQNKNTNTSLHYQPAFDAKDCTVEQYFKFWQVNAIIHGHTHRPKTHTYQLNAQPHYRYVLGDWGNQDCAWFLRISPKSIQQETFQLNGGLK